MTGLAAHCGLLDSIAQRGRLRRLAPIAGADFASNDYLGLAGSTLIRDLTSDALARGVPPGSGAARLLRGNHDAFIGLETEAAAHFGSDAALYFGAGYTANLALFSALPQARDLVVHDALIHASAVDGMRLGAAETRAFAHNQADAAEEAIVNWRSAGGRGSVWIATESLFSMDGDRAPLADLAAVAERHDAFLIVDEAHATGIWGPEGRGLAADIAGREQALTLHTCGKALGVQGALVCAAQPLVDLLVNRARGFIYSTAPSPLLAEVLRGVLAHLARDPARREQLLTRVARAGALARDIGLRPTGSQIQPVLLAGDVRVLAAAAALQDQGFDIRAIRAPTVPKGQERLRLSLTLNVEEDTVAAAFAAVGAILA